MDDFIFIIYSCKKNLEIANNIYLKINKKINKTKVYIIYGDTLNAPFDIIDDKYIVLNVKDDYDNLTDKTINLIKVIYEIFPTIEGMFKCDDDIIVNLNHINEVTINLNLDYCGNYVINKKLQLSKHHIGKSKCNEPTVIPACTYCGGPLYFLSKNAMSKFLKDVTYFFCEDVTVGYHLNANGIFPNNINLYTDNVNNRNVLSYHNYNHTIYYCYIRLTGGLGNQLFQIFSAMNLSIKYSKKFVINTNFIIKNEHQKDLNEIINTLKSLNLNLNFLNLPVSKNIYNEKQNDGYIYNQEIDNYMNNNLECALTGNFINFNYFPDNLNLTLKSDVKLNFDNLYFIHIRLGDYLNGNHKQLHLLNLNKYYEWCINSIKSFDENAKFIICTNELNNIFYDYLNKFPKESYLIQDINDTCIDTLFIMMNCKGGICANSTLSYIGSYLQKNKNKNTNFMPYPHVNMINGFSNDKVNDYPEWCTVYNTLTDKIK